MLNRGLLILLFIFSGVLSYSQPVPADDENIPYLVTFSKDALPGWGDDDFIQIFFFVIPENYKQPFYISVFDPDIGGTIDESDGPFNSETEFSFYGGLKCWSDKAAQSEHPSGNFKSGKLLASKVFGVNPRYDNNWYKFGPFNPVEGELVTKFGGYVFKMIIHGIKMCIRDRQLQNSGVGLSFMNEKRGYYRQMQIYGNYSYRIVSGENTLALGFRAGAHIMSTNWSNISTIDPDAAFMEATPNVVLPNFGLGLYYYTGNYFAGISVPYLLTYKTSPNSTKLGATHDFRNYTFLVTSGFTINAENFKVTPSFLLKYNSLYGEQIDLNVMAYLLKDKLGIGNSFRLHDAYCMIVDYQINPQLRTGFSYDFPVAKFSRYFNGSVEFVLRYILKYKIPPNNPRYF